MAPPVVAVALSGGVDSLVAGYLIKQAHKNVFGIHFTTGFEKISVDVNALELQLGFPVHTIDLSQVFEQEVVAYFMNTYLEGRTPNPCVVCNQKIKFGALLNEARALGADALATGHYATIVNPLSFPDRNISNSWLEKGADPLKDQSYFLSMLSADQLEQILLPLAGYSKLQVKAVAKKTI